MKIHYLLVLLALLVGLDGCGRKIPFPDQSTVPVLASTAIDGTWRPAAGNIASVFRIEKGRMYYYEKQKPRGKPPGLLPTTRPKPPDFRSAIDYGRRPGSTIAMDIRPTADPGRYSCRVAGYDAQQKVLVWGPGEIEVYSENYLIFRSLPSVEAGVPALVEEALERVIIADETRFVDSLKQARKWRGDSGYRPATRTEILRPARIEAKGARRGPPGETRKITIVPVEKMEAGGRLSRSAKDFIRETIRDAQRANASVEIRCPPSTPRSVINALNELGASVLQDNLKQDYELVIMIQPESR